MQRSGMPMKQGLYNPSEERENCGVGFIAQINGQRSHVILEQGLQILKKLKHRGAVGADPTTGDGAGIMLQIPHEFFKNEMACGGVNLPDPGEYAVGMVFLPQEPNTRLYCEGVVERLLQEGELSLLGWREVPVNEYACGNAARATRPVVSQFFVGISEHSKDAFKRKLLLFRKTIQRELAQCHRPSADHFYICSLSMETIVYKGQILGHQLEAFYKDLSNLAFKTAFAIVHERYSTNTFPSWKLAHPFRYLAHNGEINTIRGNINWMKAREGVLKSKVFGEQFNELFPVIEPEGSDSSSLDNILELFVENGHSLAHTMMMLIPEPWQQQEQMDPHKRAFYEYHARIMEPWDGPASIVFTDGLNIGAMADRNGLRPARYVLTKDGLMVLASESGVIEFEPETIVKKGSLKPNEMLFIDLVNHRVRFDREIKEEVIQGKDYLSWIRDNQMHLDDLEDQGTSRKLSSAQLITHQRAFGYTGEEVHKIIGHMAEFGEEPISAMGYEAPLAILTDKPQLLFNYFKQKFAQVTNPPIDPIREKCVMSLVQFMGQHGQMLGEIETHKHRPYFKLESPILTNEGLEKLKNIYNNDFKGATLPMTFEIDKGEAGLKEALAYLCSRTEENIQEGYNIIVLSDRNLDRYNAPIPSLLALGAVHHHLIEKKLRTKADLIIECGDARDVMHMALLIGYGAKAINPYLALETIRNLHKGEKLSASTYQEAHQRYRKAIDEGLLKIISKMGISTLQSYNGAQIFEILGLSDEVALTYFSGTTSSLSGMGLDLIAQEVILRHQMAFKNDGAKEEPLEPGAEFFAKGEDAQVLFNPERRTLLRQSCKTGNDNGYKRFVESVTDQETGFVTLRSLLRFKTSAQRPSIPLEQVEPVEEICKRFTTGALSFGSISQVCHETMAIAMNQIGAKSNSGEGGEDPKRYYRDLNGQLRKSEVKQIASGRFGVTADYLVNCSEIQIKMAQGAKPGEGGHLPGHKVTDAVARVRSASEGQTLISPPPHHDIYSIEDLAQMIFDLKNMNPIADISVKLAAESGMGTIAAGVAKAHADSILISGGDGGTGAAPISSMKYAGVPWEIGLSETQQTLLLNDLRGRVSLQVDGKLSHGKDVVIAAMLGAESYGFSTAALIVCGCVMCRNCHTGKCPVGIASQGIEFTKHFQAKPQDLVHYFTFVAEEVREILAALGFTSMDQIIGRVELLEPAPLGTVNLGPSHKMSKRETIQFERLLYRPELPQRIAQRKIMLQNHDLASDLSDQLRQHAKGALDEGRTVKKTFPILNTDRSVGTAISGEIALKYGLAGLPADSLNFKFIGSAGQSFGAFAVNGLTLTLEGDANDYLGKGLSGGKIAVMPMARSSFVAHENVIAGNTLLYGATSGEVYIAGRAGQRFCVRNSGATAVVEGIGHHGCQYMTGGLVLILGEVGRNFGAGMSGGKAIIFDETGLSHLNVNTELVGLYPLDPDEKETVLKLLKAHVDHTKSDRGKWLIAHFDEYSGAFVKVCSNEQDRVEKDATEITA